MSYSGSLAYLYGLQRFGIKLGLENVRTLLGRLGQPEQSYRIAHVAGTNGKGSTAAGLAAILGAAGHRCGLYTSPHLQSFIERIRVDGSAIAETEVVALTDEIRAVADNLPLTFFEFTTAMALLHFQRQGVVAAVIETGMGGRLDATNLVTPAVTLITPVSLDHGEYLGSDLAAIAAEKAGILKPGVPLVLASQLPPAAQVIEQRASELAAPVYRYGEHFSSRAVEAGFDYFGLNCSLAGLRPGLAGRHQQANLSLSLAAAELLARQGLPLSVAALRAGVGTVRWPGRLEWWGEGRTILLDGAHNAAGAEVLADYLREQGLDGLQLLTGVKADKDLSAVLAPLLPFCAVVHATRVSEGEAYPPAAIADLCRRHAVACRTYASPAQALAQAQADATATHPLLVAGSLYLVGEIRELLLHRKERELA